MTRVPVKSSFIVGMAYDAEKRILEFELKGNKVYQYLDVPQEIYDGLCGAASLGQSIGVIYSRISRAFACRKLEEPEEESHAAR